MRQYDNPHQLSKAIATLRVRNLDLSAEVDTYIIIRSDLSMFYYISVESALSDEQLQGLFSQPETAQELESTQSYQQSVIDFDNLPDWATWTGSEAATNIENSIFGGQTLAQVDAGIDSLPANVAGMRTGLHNAAAQIITIRNLLTFIARAIVFIRDYTIRMRR